MRTAFTFFAVVSLGLLPLAAQEAPTPLRPKDNPFAHVRLFAKSPNPVATVFASGKEPSDRCGHIRIHPVSPDADPKSISPISKDETGGMPALPALPPCPAR
jgi:hypothetical protein